MKKIIVPADETLSLNAKGILTTMLNEPESDYITVPGLCALFMNNTMNEILSAVTELVEKGYVLNFKDGRIAANKKKIHDMAMI